MTMSQPLIALLIFAALVAVGALVFWPDWGLWHRWKRSRKLDERVLIEDALKHLYKSQAYDRKATIQSCAGSIGISANQAADLLERLAEMELVELKEDGYSLTPEGETYALNIIRAHRLWERYLADETGYAETEWHEQADLMEHSLTEEQMGALSAGLGYPAYDPHGDPIPTATGKLKSHGGHPLTIMPPGSLLQVVHIEDEPNAVYAQLMAEGVYPGMQLHLLEASPTRIRYWARGRESVLAPVTAANVSVRQLKAVESAEVDETAHLNDLKLGQSARVTKLSKRLRGMERRRLLDMGLIPGTVVTVELSSPSGDPNAYRVRGALIALRHDQTKYIEVEPVDNETQSNSDDSATTQGPESGLRYETQTEDEVEETRVSV